MSTKSHILSLLSSLRNRAYRALFVEAQIETLVPFQIRAMRKRKGWTQKDLAAESGMKQARISLLENPNYEGAVNVKTLLKIAQAFDVGLIVRFAPFSEVAQWSNTLTKSSHEVPTFDMEFAELEREVAANEFAVSHQAPPLTVQPSSTFSMTGHPNAA
jgi:transcriptional regulator with XRE-family HTH domain